MVKSGFFVEYVAIIDSLRIGQLWKVIHRKLLKMRKCIIGYGGPKGGATLVL